MELKEEYSQQLTPIGKSISVSFRGRVVRASEKVRRICAGVGEGNVFQRCCSERSDLAAALAVIWSVHVCCYAHVFW